MVRRALRARESLRRIKKTTPGGRKVVHYERKKPSKAKCGSCKRLLHGVPNLRPVGMKRMNKCGKRPERPYGGALCHTCLRKRIKENLYKLEA